MCGIAGFVGEGTAEDLCRMATALRHRGPDASGTWHDHACGVHLAVTRLAVVDLTGGAQPMTSDDGAIVVAFNGEIYNHAELRRDLERAGAVFASSHSDTEVLLKAYATWGEALTQRLDGMWAFAIYDARRGVVLLSRDRFGQKPLYYSRQQGTFAFASELGSLARHARITATVSSRSLQKYLAYGFIPAPHSLYAGIEKLPAGCSVTLDIASMSHRTARYWEYQLEPDDSAQGRDVPQACERLRSALERAVHRQSRADVPVGVFLSGGLDSAVVASFCAHARPGVQTFSIAFDRPAFDESAQATRVARLLQTTHVTQAFEMADLPALAEHVAQRLDEPIGDSSLLCTHLLCASARRHVTVALGGEGADELFGGYDPFRALQVAQWYARVVPRPVHQAIRLAASALPAGTGYMPLDLRVNRMLRGLACRQALWNPVWIGPVDPAELAECIGGPVDIEAVYEEAIELWERSPQASPVERTLQFFARLYLQDDILPKVDRASMMSALEVRSPYLDGEVVDIARRLPTELKVRRGTTKYLLKEAMRPLLPSWIVDQPKHGFAVPMAAWLREHDLPLQTDGLPRDIDAAFVRRKARAHRAGTENNAIFLWSVWLLAQSNASRARG